MAKWLKPVEGSWTQHYPDLGTGPVSFRDSTSPEFYELEREAIFKRAWLNVARVEELPVYWIDLAASREPVLDWQGLLGTGSANLTAQPGNCM